MFGFVFAWMLVAPDQLHHLIQLRRYLDAGKILNERAERLESPADIEAYTVLLTEFYSKQIGFRTFMLKNLLSGETLSHLRKSHENISREEIGVLIEKNLEFLLLDARKKFPGDLRIDFSLAQYLVSGRCCYVDPKIQLSHEEILDIFKRARGQGLVSATSLWVLAVDALGGEKIDSHLVSALLEQAVALNPYHEDAIYAYINDLLKNHYWDQALDQTKNLFEITLDPEMKANSLAAAARIYAAKDRCAEAFKAVKTALKFVPNHALAWMVGLDCLRKSGDKNAYSKMVNNFLNVAPEDPSAFQVYLGYLELKGFTAQDTFALTAYETATCATDLARLTRRINLGKLKLTEKEWKKAESYFTNALDLAHEMGNPPPELERTLNQLIQLARARGER